MELERVTPESVGLSSRDVEQCFQAMMHDMTSMNGFIAERHGKVFAEGWWAPYSPELVHSNHSLGKSYTATAIGIAVKEGLLSLDEKIVDIFAEDIKTRGFYFPETDLMNQVTVKHLLTMTGGQGMRPAMSTDWVGDFFRSPVTNVPGTVFKYNTSGASLLGAIIEKKSGETLKDYLAARLFDKIGIDAERFTWLTWPNGMCAEPGTFSCTEDNLRLGMFYKNFGCWDGEQIADRKFIEDAMSVQISTKHGPDQLDGKCGYGYMLWASTIPGVYRFDGGQGQFAIIWPEKDIVVAVHQGGTVPFGPQKTLDAIYDHIFAKLQDEPLPEDPEAYASMTAFSKALHVKPDKKNTIASPDAFTGHYTLTAGTLDPWIAVSPGMGEDFFKLYRDPKADREIREFDIETAEDRLFFKVGENQVFTAYLDGEPRKDWIDSVFPKLGYYYATANYITPYALEIHIHWLNTWVEAKIRLEKFDDDVRITVMKLHLDDELDWVCAHASAKYEVK